MHYLTSLIVVSLLLISSAARTEVYRYLDEGGNTVYTDQSPPVTFTSTTVDIRPNAVSGPVYNDTGQKNVILYSAEWCGICDRARDYFEVRGIDFEEYDVEQDEKGREDFAEMRGTGVPIILVGDRRMRGFRPDRFQDLFRE